MTHDYIYDKFKIFDGLLKVQNLWINKGLFRVRYHIYNRYTDVVVNMTDFRLHD